MPLELTWKRVTRSAVELDALMPAVLAGQSAADLARLLVPLASGQAPLGDLFAVEGDGADRVVRLQGDLRSVARLGQGMQGGRLEVEGDVGPHLGAAMRGGMISVRGAVDNWAGAEMRGGRIEIRGSAGRYLGAAYPGSRLGMRGGEILVSGSVSDCAGQSMRRGLMAIAGGAGAYLGHGMVAGSIILGGGSGPGVGLNMKRGTIVFLSRHPTDSLCPTFVRSGQDRPPFLNLYLQQLRNWGFLGPAPRSTDLFTRYNGDLAAGGQGEIWFRSPGQD